MKAFVHVLLVIGTVFDNRYPTARISRGWRRLYGESRAEPDLACRARYASRWPRGRGSQTVVHRFSFPASLGIGLNLVIGSLRCLS